mmetsp:Transcript_43722/g.85789  ORF Transcript_43722/g.85789 Transcript_43722/m.85789 type:complete len:122 (-) Transcript_43722:366-731(-)
MVPGLLPYFLHAHTCAPLLPAHKKYVRTKEVSHTGVTVTAHLATGATRHLATRMARPLPSVRTGSPMATWCTAHRHHWTTPAFFPFGNTIPTYPLSLELVQNPRIWVRSESPPPPVLATDE